MANTYQLIASNTLGSSAASVTFSSIPATYTDLILKCSTRNTGSSFNAFFLQFDSSSSIYSFTEFYTSNGTSIDNNRATSQTSYFTRGNPSDNQTLDAFSNQEIYIPGYTSSVNKPMSGFFVGETNATAAWVALSAGLYRSTSAITTITITPALSVSIAAKSSFFLYGIKNS